MKNKNVKTMKNLKIYLFRHGQTYYNEKGIFTGQKKSKLTPKGIKNAKTIARKLKNKKFQVAFYTCLPRSKNTLKYVLKYHPECKKLIKDNRMIERSYGNLEGTSHDSFIKKIGKRAYNLRIEGDAIENLSQKLRKERTIKLEADSTTLNLFIVFSLECLIKQTFSKAALLGEHILASPFQGVP